MNQFLRCVLYFYMILDLIEADIVKTDHENIMSTRHLYILLIDTDFKCHSLQLFWRSILDQQL